MKYLFLCTIGLIMAGCMASTKSGNTSTQPPIYADSEWFTYENTAFHYKIELPQSAFIPGKSSTGNRISFGNMRMTYPRENEFRVSLYASQHPDCSPTFLGAAEVTELANSSGTAIWGKVDFFERYYSGESTIDYEGPRPICQPISFHSPAYALCSKNDGHSVLICISQVTDDPALAQQIFETFRWTR